MKLMRLMTSFLFVTLLCLTPAFAADVPQSAYSGDPELLAADGWTETVDGVYRRTVDGRHQTLAYGDAAPRLVLGWLDTQITLLTDSFEESGSAEVAATLQDLEQRRDELIADSERPTRARAFGGTDLLVSGETSGLDQVGCNIVPSVDAAAGPILGGPQAAATTGFSDDCGSSAEVYCYAFARGYDGFVYNDGTQADGPRTVTGSGSCSVSKSVDADNNCFATSTSQVNFTDDFGNPATLLERDSTSACYPMALSITGGSSYYSLEYGSCAYPTFTAGSNYANTSFSWSWNGSPVGTGSTYSPTFCNYETSEFTTLNTLTLTGTASGETGQVQTTVTIEYKSNVVVE